MKRSEELLGLSVISIEDGKEIGRVSDFVINPAKGLVEFLIIDNGFRYMGIKILPFKMVEGVGEYAVTILSSTSITDLSEEPEVNELLEKNVRVKGTKVLTKKGKLIGNVSEFIIDDDNEGKIAECEVAPMNGAGSIGFIDSEHIITFGKDVLVISDDAEMTPPSPQGPRQEGKEPDALLQDETADLDSLAAQPVDPAVPGEQAGETDEDQADDNPVQGADTQAADTQAVDQQPAEKQEQSEAAKLFEERQRQYLLGRKVSKRIETESGELVAEEGETITGELLDKAKAAGKFTELSMNTRA